MLEFAHDLPEFAHNILEFAHNLPEFAQNMLGFAPGGCLWRLAGIHQKKARLGGV
jgi:hypothetical protein